MTLEKPPASRLGFFHAFLGKIVSFERVKWTPSMEETQNPYNRYNR
jgi:hypothetical protein